VLSIFGISTIWSPRKYVSFFGDIVISLKTAEDFGITSLTTPERYGLTLVLGGGEVLLLELSSAYGVFATEGIKNEYKYILRIEDVSGNILFESRTNPIEVIDKNVARAINDILSDNDARAPSFGEFSALYFPGKQVAAKTGTTNDFRDAWIVGYTPSVVIGAWAGNNDNSPMEKRVAGFIVAPMWREVMKYYLENYPNENFTPPEKFPASKPVLKGEWRGGAVYIIDKISRKLATEYTPFDLREEKAIQNVHSILYWINKDDPQGIAPKSTSSDSQFNNWDTQVIKWAETNGFLDEDESIIPTEYDDIHTPEKFPKIKEITISPKKDTYFRGDQIVLIPKIESTYDIIQVDYFETKSNFYLGTTKRSPFSIALNINRFLPESEEVTGNKIQIPITIKVYDSVGNKIEQQIFLPSVSY